MNKPSFSNKLQILFLLLSLTFVCSGTGIFSASGNGHSADLGANEHLSPVVQTENSPNAWRGLVPLQSTRTDVEKLLGKPVSSRGSIVVYKTDEGEVAVVFSAGKCDLSSSESWNVPASVVITIELRPKRRVLIQDLHLDPNKYRRVQQSHPENWFVYRNAEDGFMVETLVYENKEEVVVLTYFPGVKAKALRCPSTHKRIM
ncbi:MAG TPA: hypothetical protein VE980_17395 [Pyrinomonadaceae bacterium]|nr:hypothetical protein [Pyrinomonadaceae bacterium]